MIRYWPRIVANPAPRYRVEPQIEQAVLDFALAFPAHGQVRVSHDLRERGVFVSPGDLGSQDTRSLVFRHGSLDRWTS